MRDKPARDGEWKGEMGLNPRNGQDSKVRKELGFQTGEEHKQNT